MHEPRLPYIIGSRVISVIKSVPVQYQKYEDNRSDGRAHTLYLSKSDTQNGM